MNKTVVSISMILCLLLPSLSSGEQIIKPGEFLNVQRAVEIASTWHPSVIASKYGVDAARIRIEQARANYFPQIDATAAYNRTDPYSTVSGLDVSGTRVSTSHSFDQYFGTITLSQTIYDFGRTGAEVSIQRMQADASSEDLGNLISGVVLNVKQAYYSLLRARKNRGVASDTVRQFEQHLAQAKGFYEVGVKPKFDVTKAEVDLSNARLNLISAENELKIARITLNNAMGVPNPPEYDIEDNLSWEKHEYVLPDLTARAFENRHDLKSLSQKTKAAEEALRLAEKGHFPVLSGNASVTTAGQEFPLDDGWSAGITLTIPVFSGFLTKNRIEEAKANTEAARAVEESLRQAVSLEVERAYLSLIEAEERIGVSELIVRQAAENYEIASGRYREGVSSPIEVTDAEVALSNAKTGQIKALYDFKVARASLEKATGQP